MIREPHFNICGSTIGINSAIKDALYDNTSQTNNCSTSCDYTDLHPASYNPEIISDDGFPFRYIAVVIILQIYFIPMEKKHQICREIFDEMPSSLIIQRLPIEQNNQYHN